MGMRRWRWWRWWQATAAVAAAALLLWPRELRNQEEGKVSCAAHRLWDYVADFNHLRELDPDIEWFHVVRESGNYDSWRYTVEYTKRPHAWWSRALGVSSARGTADVRVHSRGHGGGGEAGSFHVLADHRICLLRWLCLRWERGVEVRDWARGASKGGSLSDARGEAARVLVTTREAGGVLARAAGLTPQQPTFYLRQLQQHFAADNAADGAA